MTPRDERILKDLTANLTHKILQNISDHVALCASVDIRPNAVMADLMQVLIKLTASFAANSFKVSPIEFGKVMALEFLRAQKEEEAEAEDEA